MDDLLDKAEVVTWSQNHTLEYIVFTLPAYPYWSLSKTTLNCTSRHLAIPRKWKVTAILKSTFRLRAPIQRLGVHNIQFHCISSFLLYIATTKLSVNIVLSVYFVMPFLEATTLEGKDTGAADSL